MKHNVYVEEPHIASFAASVLLRKQLNKQFKNEWLEFRTIFLKEKRDEFGDLICFYCGKDKLVEEIEDNTDKSQLRTLATLDHIKPVSKDGEWYDKNNLVVCCFRCNQKKADKY